MRRQELHPRTEALNKVQKNKSKKARDEALIWLANTFPHVFDNRNQIRPLKVGIMQDIVQYADEAEQAGISRSKLREAVVLYTRRIDYLTCLKAREMRIDLNGKVVSMVTEDEAERAATKIKKRVEKSARNARKLLTSKTQGYVNPKSSFPSLSTHAPQRDPSAPFYSERAVSYNSAQQSLQTSARPAASVIIKHKTSRSFDPSAVARLKEKLGLSSNRNQKELAEAED